VVSVTAASAGVSHGGWAAFYPSHFQGPPAVRRPASTGNRWKEASSCGVRLGGSLFCSLWPLS